MKTIKKFILAYLLTIGIFAPNTAMALGKIAVLNTQEAILSSGYAQKIFTEFKEHNDYKNKTNKIRALHVEIKAVNDRLIQEHVTMGSEDKQALLDAINRKSFDVKSLTSNLRADEQQIIESVVKSMAPHLQKVVEDIIKIEGIGLLLNESSVMHADVGYNITQKVTEKLNRISIP